MQHEDCEHSTHYCFSRRNIYRLPEDQHERNKEHGDGKHNAPVDIIYSVQRVQQCGGWRKVSSYGWRDPQLDVEHRTSPPSLLVQVGRPIDRGQPPSQDLRDIDTLPSTTMIEEREKQVVGIMRGKSSALMQGAETVRVVTSNNEREPLPVTGHFY